MRERRWRGRSSSSAAAAQSTGAHWKNYQRSRKKGNQSGLKLCSPSVLPPRLRAVER